jgi:acetyltransferase-like isoleucine patch superfamily enzyme
MKLGKFIKSPFMLLNAVFLLFLTHLPGQIGYWLRYQFYKRRFKSCGKKVIIEVGVIIVGAEYITVGDNTIIDKYCIINAGKANLNNIKRKQNTAYQYDEGELIIGSNIHIAQFCIIMAYGGVYIGDNCALSAGTKIYSLTNTPNDLDDRSKVISIMPLSSPESPFLMSPVVLEKNVWIGLDCIVMPGVHIEENSFVVSKSLVMGTFPANSYISGQPAERIRKRFLTTDA